MEKCQNSEVEEQQELRGGEKDLHVQQTHSQKEEREGKTEEATDRYNKEVEGRDMERCTDKEGIEAGSSRKVGFETVNCSVYSPETGLATLVL